MSPDETRRRARLLSGSIHADRPLDLPPLLSRRRLIAEGSYALIVFTLGFLVGVAVSGLWR